MNTKPIAWFTLFLGLNLCAHSAPVNPRSLAARWSFDGNLRDASACGNEIRVEGARFVSGHAGQAFACPFGRGRVADRPELRLAPGLRIECWVQYPEPPSEGQEIVLKGNEYMLRTDPMGEGGHFAFFVYLDGWESRARSAIAPKPGEWYHLVAAWDGRELSLEVNGERSGVARTGTPVPTLAPVEIGTPEGVIDELRIENPGAFPAPVADWRFDGDLRDRSGNGHDLPSPGPDFAPGQDGQALRPGAEMIDVPDAPEFRLASGLRIECRVRFDAVPDDIRPVVIKNGEYQLRINPPQEGSQFAFFVHLDGWEPRVASRQKVEPGVWYHLAAEWDGLRASLIVNGDKTTVERPGNPAPTANPLQIGPARGLLDELRIVNPRQPAPRVRHVLQERAILLAGRPEKVTVVLRNDGAEADGMVATLELPAGIRCLDGNARPLPKMPTGGQTEVSWSLAADAEAEGKGMVKFTGGECMMPPELFPLLFQASEEARPVTFPEGKGTPGTTYYIDSEDGRNTNSGAGPDAPWRDFSHINGRTLGPGDRLLIKRGSVINQELDISARGTEENWAGIGAYGSGARPTIRRNWDIADRCAVVRDPEYLRIANLVVCYAGRGLVVQCGRRDRRGLVIEDCIAHHIEGLYRPNSHGIPEWRDRGGENDDGGGSSVGISVTGPFVRDVLIRDCEMFQCSWGFFASGDGVVIDRVFCHDNYAFNTSPHPAIVGVKRSFLQNSVFDAPGYHAHAGTMGIMLCSPNGLTIRNCTFRNQPDSGSHDQGGIDFENQGNGCLIDGCTFQNNAGAAIEVLGLRSPQATNIEIRNTRFLRNNIANKLGPSEIFVWGGTRDPSVCCSSGIVHGNGYALHPGVEFFINEAPETTVWTLRDNTQYATVEELDRAMPHNNPPEVDAGPAIHSSAREVVLAGGTKDDDRPVPRRLRTSWEVLEGPGAVTFRDPADPATAATFAAPGDYLLRLVADDGELWTGDLAAVHILEPGLSVTRAWEFDTPLDKEGWTEADLGTQTREWTGQRWPCKSHPVKYVGGGYYIVAVEDSREAHLLSAENLGIDLARADTAVIRMQNHTPAQRMRLAFTTEADPNWDEAKSATFAVTPGDTEPREYRIDLPAVPGRSGRLKQLRLDLATGEPLTGACRIDSIWLGDREASRTPVE